MAALTAEVSLSSIAVALGAPFAIAPDRLAAVTSCPRWTASATIREPIMPVAPMTVIFIVCAPFDLRIV
jgi:hypothetical protein